MPSALVPHPAKADGQPCGHQPCVIPFEGDPNGKVTATGAAIVVGKGATLGAWWVKSTEGTSNNEWLPMST